MSSAKFGSPSVYDENTPKGETNIMMSPMMPSETQTVYSKSPEY